MKFSIRSDIKFSDSHKGLISAYFLRFRLTWAKSDRVAIALPALRTDEMPSKLYKVVYLAEQTLCKCAIKLPWVITSELTQKEYLSIVFFPL